LTADSAAYPPGVVLAVVGPGAVLPDGGDELEVVVVPLGPGAFVVDVVGVVFPACVVVAGVGVPGLEELLER
jgi:hypothetical protein